MPKLMPGSKEPGAFRRLSAWWGPAPLVQFATIAAVAALVVYFCANALVATSRFGAGFGFLGHAANFEIGEGSIPFKAGDTYLLAITVGLVNTLKVAILGCIFSTILGVAIGVAGLSRNLLLGGLVRWYIEIVRNTPLLLQLFFWAALVQALPGPRRAISLLHAFYLTNRGVFVPAIQVQGWTHLSWLVLIGLAALGAGAAIALWQKTRSRSGAGIVLLLAAAAAVSVALPMTGVRFALDLPAVAGFNIRGGTSVTPEFTALLVGLAVKFSATMAEIVRAGIESVNRGQWEAARALGLHNDRIIRKIVLPQALRVATPLATSSYLDLTKDSSLAVAIGYPDVVSIINTTANTTGQSLEALTILVGLFLTINLAVSAAMNVYNRRVAMRGGGAR